MYHPSSLCYDRALAHNERVCTLHRRTSHILAPHLARDANHPYSQRGSRDEERVEVADREEETTVILDWCGRLAEAESE